jgi:hypothetical protein
MRWRTSGTRRFGPREWLVAVVLAAVGLLNLLPGVALLAPDRLSSLYGIAGPDPDLLVLLRHRALLLALLGGFLIVAALRAGWHRPALVAGLLSNAVFVLLALAAPTSEEIHRVATIDLVALPLLVAGLLLTVRRSVVEPSRTTIVGADAA